ncbi:MAG: amino acid permease [Thaumarchaeota archaeon]|nr:amino acid permease [Nitrososphaerota archaeon]
MAERRSELVRSLSLLDITMIGIAAMIGGAIFVLVGPAMNEAGPALMIVFVINGVITFFTALVYAELGSALPEAGGGYKWIREGLPRPNAFISGWMAWFAHMIAGSLYAVGFGSFLGHFLTIIGLVQFAGIDKLIAVLSIVLFTYVNVRGISETGKIGNAVTFSQLAIIGILIVAGLIATFFVEHDWAINFESFMPNGAGGLLIAMALTFIAFEGYEIIVQTGEEVKNPKKNIPKAIFLSLAGVVGIYILFTFVFLGGVDSQKIGTEVWKFIGENKELGIVKAADYIIPFGTILVLVGGFVSTLSALNATTFSSSRVAFAMGRQFNLPKTFSSIHTNYRTPYFATIISGIVMIIMAASLPLEQIALAAGVMFLFLFIQVNIAAITIRRLYGSKLDYGFKTPFFPVIPIIGVFTQIGLAIYLLIFNPLSWLIAVIWIMIGFTLYKMHTAKKEIEHYAPSIINEIPQKRQNYRILIHYNGKSIKNLVKIANVIAGAKDAEISYLNVVNVPIQLPLSSSREIADNEVHTLENLKKELGDSDSTGYLIRLSHDVTEAILATIEEQGTNLLVIDFDDLKNNRKLMSLATCDIVGVLVRNNFENEISNVVVSYDKGRHCDLALEVADSFLKSQSSKIRIVRATTDTPEKELNIINKINEKMFDLGWQKIPLERFDVRDDTLVPKLLQNFSTAKPELIMVGAGNQSEQAFSPKTLEIITKSKKSFLVISDSRFSEIHARYFWDKIGPRLKENRYFYRIYSLITRYAKYIQPKPKSFDDYFN